MLPESGSAGTTGLSVLDRNGTLKITKTAQRRTFPSPMVTRPCSPWMFWSTPTTSTTETAS